MLVIDDDDGFCETHRAAFELRGITVDVANTWEDGLGLFQVCAHELVVADYQLPGSENGFVLLAAAKQHRPATALVLISGVLASSAGSILDGSPIVDAYYAKEPDILDRLMPHVVSAQESAAAPADWPRTASAWLSRNVLSTEEIAEFDAELRSALLSS